MSILTASDYKRVKYPQKLSLGTRLAQFTCVTIVEAVIVYLSIGAPFGVLQFFSHQGQRPIAVAAKSLAAMLLWPYFAVSWNLARKKWHKIVRTSGKPDMTLLFEIAGHSNPELATLCYERRRRRISELDRSSPAFPVLNEGSPASELSHLAAATPII